MFYYLFGLIFGLFRFPYKVVCFLWGLGRQNIIWCLRFFLSYSVDFRHAQNQQNIKSLLQQPQAHHHHHHFSVYPEFQLTGRTGVAMATAAESMTDKQHSVIADTVSSHNLAFHIENLIQKKHTATGGVVGEMSQEEIVSSSGVHNNNDPHSTDDHQSVAHESKPKLIIINDEDDSNNSNGSRRL